MGSINAWRRTGAVGSGLVSLAVCVAFVDEASDESACDSHAKTNRGPSYGFSQSHVPASPFAWHVVLGHADPSCTNCASTRRCAKRYGITGRPARYMSPTSSNQSLRELSFAVDDGIGRCCIAQAVQRRVDRVRLGILDGEDSLIRVTSIHPTLHGPRRVATAGCPSPTGSQQQRPGSLRSRLDRLDRAGIRRCSAGMRLPVDSS